MAYVHRGAHLDALDADLYTPLLTAAVYGQERAFECLMKAGAPIDVVDRNRKSCVFLAAADNHVGILKVNEMSPVLVKSCERSICLYGSYRSLSMTRLERSSVGGLILV